MVLIYAITPYASISQAKKLVKRVISRAASGGGAAEKEKAAGAKLSCGDDEETGTAPAALRTVSSLDWAKGQHKVSCA